MTRRASYLALALSLAVGGCETPSGSDDGGTTPGVDSGTTPDADSGGPSDAGATTIAFTSPDVSLDFARGTVRLQLVTTGPDPDRVELWRDGALLVVLPLPYTYDWFSDADAEGEHVFEARALRDVAMIASAERRFTIDRTGPQLVEARPSEGEAARLSDGIEIELSEPLDAGSVTLTSVTVQSGGADVTAERTLSSDGTTIRILPSGVALPTDVSVIVSTAVTDRAGNALAEEITFVVHYNAWAALLPTGTFSEERYIQQIAVAGSDVYVLHTSASQLDARVSRWDGTTLWALPALPSMPIADTARMKLASTGALVVAWAVDTMRDIHVATLDDEAWDEQPVLPGLDATTSFFTLEVGPSDEPYIARVVGTARIQTMRLSGGAWSALGAEIDPGATYPYDFRFSFALDDTRPVFAIRDGSRCLFVTETSSFVAVAGGSSSCSGMPAVVDVPGLGAEALISVSVRTGIGMSVYETQRWRGADDWSFVETGDGVFWAALAETSSGWIAARLHDVVSSGGERWPLDTGQVWAIDMFHGAPIVASYHQLHVPNGSAIAP